MSPLWIPPFLWTQDQKIAQVRDVERMVHSYNGMEAMWSEVANYIESGDPNGPRMSPPQADAWQKFQAPFTAFGAGLTTLIAQLKDATAEAIRTGKLEASQIQGSGLGGFPILIIAVAIALVLLNIIPLSWFYTKHAVDESEAECNVHVQGWQDYYATVHRQNANLPPGAAPRAPQQAESTASAIKGTALIALVGLALWTFFGRRRAA